MKEYNNLISIDQSIVDKTSKIFNYSFNSIDHLTEALVSISLVEEKHLSNMHNSFNRLVFLGENLLLFIVGELVYLNFPRSTESILTNIRAEITNNETLGAFAINQGISELVMTTKGEDNMKIKENKNKMAEVLKALFGAIYLDCNKDHAIAKIIIRDFIEPIFKFVFMNKRQFVYFNKTEWKYKENYSA